MTELKRLVKFNKGFHLKPKVFYTNEAERIKLKYKKSQIPKVNQLFVVYFLCFKIMFNVSLQ